MTPDWLAQEMTAEARRVALERLARYERERDERMAGYRQTWERQWAQQRSTAATVSRGLWRVVR